MGRIFSTMYSNKGVNKWAGALFLSSSEPWTSKEVDNRRKLDSRFKGLQFKCNPPKSGRAGLFSTLQYESAPPRKYERKKMARSSGFGSADIADRAEFAHQSRQVLSIISRDGF